MSDTPTVPEAGPQPVEGSRYERMQRVEAMLTLHSGEQPWGENDGSLRSTLEAWHLQPDDFLESLDAWGYEIVVRQRPAVSVTDYLEPRRHHHDDQVLSCYRSDCEPSPMTPPSRAFHGQAAAIIKVALAAMGYSDAQADARLSAFLSEQSDRTSPSSPRAGRSTVSDSPAAGEPRTEAGQAHRRYLHAIVHGPNADGTYDCKDGCECAADILAIEAEAAASPAGPEAAGIRNRLLASRFDPSVSLDELIGAGPEAVPQSERGGLDVERLASLIIEYRFDQHEESSEWGSWESLWDRLASIHGRPGDSSRREAGAMLRHLIALASPAHPDEEPGPFIETVGFNGWDNPETEGWPASPAQENTPQNFLEDLNNDD